MTLPQVIIVGAGVTGSMLALLVKDMGLPVSVKIVEKSRGAGGRMATHRLRRGGGGRAAPIAGRADLGAQYITTRSSPQQAVLGPLYASLLEASVLKPFDGKVAGPNPYGDAGTEVRHFMAPAGLQSVSEHFLASSGAEVQWDTALRSLELLPNGGVNMELFGASDGSQRPDVVLGGGGDTSEAAPPPPSIVVLTQPVPQVLGRSKFPLSGNFVQRLDKDTAQALGQVQYSSRFAAAYYFDASEFSWPHDWTAHYFTEGDVRYVAHDTGKRGATEESVISILVHSDRLLGEEFQDEASPFETATKRITSDLAKKMPEVPWERAAEVKVRKWLYSQVYRGVGNLRPSPDWTWDSGDKGFPGCMELFRSENVLGLLAGDATAPASNSEGCVFSAHKTAEAVRQFIAAAAAPGGRSGGNIPAVPKSDL